MNVFVRLFGVDRVLDIDYTTLARLWSGKLLQIVHSGMESYSFVIYEGIGRGMELVVSLIALILVLSLENIRFLGFFVVAWIVLIRFQKIAFIQLANARERDVDLNESYTKQTTKILMNFILLKIYGLKQKELDQLYHIGMNRVDNFMRIKFRFNAVASIANFLLIILLLVCLRYFGRAYVQGNVGIDIFFFVFLLLSFSRQQFYAFWLFVAELSEKLTYIKRFDEVVSESKNSSDDDSLKKSTESLRVPISFEAVAFKHDGAKEYLYENFSLEIPYGQHVALVGRSGSGKSTLFNMLTRLVLPEQGRIVLWTYALETLSYKTLYSRIGYFYQDPLVFDGSIRQNLSFNTLHSDEELTQALVKVGLSELSLDTVIGERGILLSWGEKQRLALARVFLFDFDILLLDEPTSNLDLALEKEILLQIFETYRDKTILIISHRPFVLDHVDRVIVLAKGMIVHDGSYDDIKEHILV